MKHFQINISDPVEDQYGPRNMKKTVNGKGGGPICIPIRDIVVKDIVRSTTVMLLDL